MRLYRKRGRETDTFTHGSFYAQTLLHTDAFTHRHLYTQTLLHADTFARKHFYIQTLLHTDTFTHRHFYTQKSEERRRACYSLVSSTKDIVGESFIEVGADDHQKGDRTAM